jgi:molecular chaperone GrpE
MEQENTATSAAADGSSAPADNAPAPDAPLSPQEIADLKSRAAKADENWDRYVRLMADFDNFKKRAARERLEGIKAANESLLQKLIPIADTFDMAIAAASAANVTAQSLQAGVAMIHSQFKSTLADAGLEEINALGQPFDPNLHEAVSEQVTSDAPEGQVVQQLRKGYRLREKLVRPASVVVAKKPSSS